MKQIIILTFLSFFIGCAHKKTEIKNSIHQLNLYSKEKDSLNGFNYLYYYKKTNNPYKKENVLYKFDSLILYKNDEKYNINLTSKNILSETIEGNVYVNNDFNFDGYQDVMIFPYRELPFNYRSYHFLFNPKNKEFEEQIELDSIYNEQICAKSKTIFSIYDKPTSAISYLKKYKWKNGNINNIEEIEEEKLPNGVYQIKLTNIEKNETKVFKSKKSIISNINCK